MRMLLLLAVAVLVQPASATDPTPVHGIPLAGDWLPCGYVSDVITFGSNAVFKHHYGILIVDLEAANGPEVVVNHDLSPDWVDGIDKDGNRCYIPLREDTGTFSLLEFDLDFAADTTPSRTWDATEWFQPGGYIKAFDVCDGVLYSIVGNDLLIIDLEASPASITHTLTFDGVPWHTFVKSGVCYVAETVNPGEPDAETSTWFIDLAAPEGPGIAGSMPGYLWLDSEGENAIYSRLGQGYQRYDMSDPLDPVLVWSLEGSYFYGADHIGSYIVSQALDVLDQSDPANPAIVTTLDFGTPFEPSGGNIAFNGDIACRSEWNGISFTDLSDLFSPTLIERWGVSDNTRGVRVSDDILIIEGDGYTTGLVEKSTPGSPSGHIISGSEHTVAFPWGDRVAIPYVSSGVEIWDVSDPSAATLEGSRSPISAQGGVFPTADTIFALPPGLDQLHYYDAADPFSDPDVAVMPIPYRPHSKLVWAGTGLVCISDDLGLRIFDISDDTAPALLEDYPFMGVEHVAANESIIATCLPGLGVSVLVRTPAGELETAGSFVVPDPVGVHVAGDLMAVLDGTGLLSVYDIGDPSTPLATDSFDLGRPMRGMAVDATTVYAVADESMGTVWTYQDLLSGIVSNDPIDPEGTIPTALVLGAHPNPFNPRTTLSVDLPIPGEISLTVHDARGRRVGTVFRGSRGVGRHVFDWDGTGDDGRALPSGVYVATVKTASGTRGVKMTLAR